jgi:hypothetical protein
MAPLFVTFGITSLRSNLPKRLAGISFSSDGSCIVAADRIGDVYLLTLPAIPTSEIEAPSSIDISEDDPPLLGHFSTVTDVAMTSGFVATSDRDNRVRVSCFPLAVEIQSMCLGHTDFVTRVCWVSPTRLLSAGGDGSIRLWSSETGTELSSVIIAELCNDNRKADIIVSLSCNGDLAAAVVHGHANVIVVAGLSSGKLYVARSFGLAAAQGGPTALPTTVALDNASRAWVSAAESTTLCAYALSCDGENPDAGLEPVETIAIGGGVDTLETTSQWLSGLRKKEFVDVWKGKKRRREGDGGEDNTNEDVK